MKRSEINRAICKAEAFFAKFNFLLPPFAFWVPDDWANRGEEIEQIRRCKLGWDVTDLATGRFPEVGLVLFTIRNGDPIQDLEDSKCYAEKIMMIGEEQITPWHFHWTKSEDIINRGGGNIIIELGWASKDENSLENRTVEVSCDGILKQVASGGSLRLSPGESISIPPKLYHKFYGEKGHGSVLVGEVSRTNNDETDNRFLEPLGRFPPIEGDAQPYRLLCNEYPPSREG